MAHVEINPSASRLGRVNAVLNGRGARHYARFAGPLSVKMVVDGRATWETGDGRYELVPGSALLLNDGEEYSLTIESLQPVETFCLFFARGFVEDAFRATTRGSAELLESPQELPPVSLDEKLSFDSAVVHLLLIAHEDPNDLAATFESVALELVRMQKGIEERVASLPSLRASTRAELARRLAVATAYLHANSNRDVSVAEAARAACLSPFHFHRLFTSYHGMTPHRYLTRLRLQRARALLQNSDSSVLDVAIDCGFESLGSFATLYRRTFGMTPATTKKQDSRNAPRPDGPTMEP